MRSMSYANEYGFVYKSYRKGNLESQRWVCNVKVLFWIWCFSVFQFGTGISTLAAPFSWDLYRSGDAVDIPDPGTGTVSADITIPNNFDVDDVDVTVMIKNISTGHITVFIEHVESGIKVKLFDERNGNGLHGTTFDSDATLNLRTGTNFYRETFMPERTLDAFNTLTTAQGTWRLTVDNLQGSGQGQLVCFSVSFNGVLMVSSRSDSEVDKEIGGPGSPGARSEIVVPANRGFIIGDVNVGFNIDHTKVGHLEVTLGKNNGPSKVLFSSIGSDGNNFRCTEINDESSTNITGGDAPYSASFTSAGMVLSDFAGEDADGQWALLVKDLVSGTDNGMLLEWWISFQPPVFVDFAAPSQSILESDPPKTVAVVLSNAQNVTVTVPINISGGSATNIIDYTISPNTVEFLPGVTSRNVTITVMDDTILEANETIIISLGTPTNALIGTTPVHTVTIIDDDIPEVSFETGTSDTANEGPLTHNVSVKLNLPGGGRISNPVTVDVIDDMTGVATSGVDYVALPIPTTLTFPSGAFDGVSESLDIFILPDTVDDNNETINLSLNNLSGGAIFGSQTTHQVTTVEEQGLVAHYPFEGNADDLSGNENDGVPQNGVAFDGGVYDQGQAVSLDGIEDYIEVAHDTSIMPTAAVTVSAWVKLNNLEDSPTIVSKQAWTDSLDNAGYFLRIAAGKPKFTILNNGVNPAVSTSDITVGQWYHLVGTFDSEDVKIYVDSQLTGMTAFPGTIKSHTVPLRIGEKFDGFRVDGLIDDVRIYDRTLTDQEIEALYDTYIDLNFGLGAHYEFENNTNDSTLNKNNGTPFNNPGFTGGVDGQAVSLDGIDQYNEILHDPTIMPTEAITVSAWVNLDSLDDDPTPVFKGRWNSELDNGGYLLRISDSIPRFAIQNDGRTTAVSTSPITVGQWYHLVGTFDGAALNIYIDGQLTGSFAHSGTIKVSTNSLLICQRASLKNVDGFMDDVRIYNRALTEREVEFLFETFTIPPM